MVTKIPTRVFVILTICLFIVSICGCKNYVGIEWVVDYSAVGKSSPQCRDDCAEGFYNEICALPDWIGRFNRGDANAWEEHFKCPEMGGTDPDWIDNVDLAYFSGHGAGEGTIAGPTGVGRGGGFTFGIDAHDDWVLSAIPSNREPKWGDKKLEWIVLDVCSALAFKSDGDGVLYTICERWANSDVMHGLHYILGFRTLAHDSCNRGKFFAEYLTGTRDGTKYTVREAWRKATEDTEGLSVKGAYLRASSPGCNTYNDHIHDCGSVSKDPDPACQCYCYSSWPCN
ncbi:hypothetical protein KAW18_12855 [candidate division WOR-3 bacterium]|nr:hypothetical protein [candidate division WOR-3 bacterium]MCK4528254.1 hypothetical protein [candidate division WOR-3 bacterium]